MKICPNCRQTYNDDSLNFCLNDGSVLTQVHQPNRLPETVLMNPPGNTNRQNRNPAPTNQPANWNSNLPETVKPKKNSQTMIWVLITLGLVGLLCGGSFLGLLGLSQIQNDNSANQNVSNKNQRFPVNSVKSTSPEKNPTPVNSENHIPYQSIDLSGWVRENNETGITDYADDELTIGSKKKGFYYVLVAPPEYQTDDAVTRVTLRNKEQMNSNLGYGLIFHSNPVPLLQDYAFLIDTVKKRFRIVNHSTQKETVVVNWTNTAAIKGDSNPNVLEVRDAKGAMDFYINGQKAAALPNSKGFQNGVAGIYAGDGAKISFSNLEIDK